LRSLPLRFLHYNTVSQKSNRKEILADNVYEIPQPEAHYFIDSFKIRRIDYFPIDYPVLFRYYYIDK